MTPIKASAQHIISQIKTVPAFGNRVGFAVGGRDEIDPLNMKLPMPFAWVIFTGDTNIDGLSGSQTQTKGLVVSQLNFTVKVVTRYAGKSTTGDDILNEIDILSDTAKAVNGQAPFPGAHRWRYEGQSLVGLADGRQEWDQQYSVAVPF